MEMIDGIVKHLNDDPFIGIFNTLIYIYRDFSSINPVRLIKAYRVRQKIISRITSITEIIPDYYEWYYMCLCFMAKVGYTSKIIDNVSLGRHTFEDEYIYTVDCKINFRIPDKDDPIYECAYLNLYVHDENKDETHMTVLYHYGNNIKNYNIFNDDFKGKDLSRIFIEAYLDRKSRSHITARHIAYYSLKIINLEIIKAIKYAFSKKWKVPNWGHIVSLSVEKNSNPINTVTSEEFI